MITADQLRAARALAGMDQRTLAEKAGVSLPTIQRMEASDGTVRCVVDTLTKVIEAFEAAGVDLDAFQSNHEGALIDRVHAARGDMISFLDADDLLTPTSFEKLALGLMLANNGFPLKYDPQLKLIEDRTPGKCWPDMKRTSKERHPALPNVPAMRLYLLTKHPP